RERREDDGVDLGELDARALGRQLARRYRQIARADPALFYVTTFTDPGALLDPLVARGHQLREVVVGDDARRYVASDAQNRGACHRLLLGRRREKSRDL